MSNAVLYISFKLAKGVSESDFLAASEKLNKEFMSKQKGYISWKLLSEGETWADLLVWETEADAQRAMDEGSANPLAHEFFSFIDGESTTVSTLLVKKSN